MNRSSDWFQAFMMTNSPQVADLLQQAERLPACFAQVAVIEEAVRIADSSNDIDAGYQARKALMNSAMAIGRTDVMIVAFAWCRAQFQRTPEKFDAFHILWSYRTAIGQLSNYPNVSRTQLEELIAEMAQKYTEAGYSLRPVQLKRRRCAPDLGDIAMARDAHRQMKKYPRDAMSDSEFEEESSLLDHYFFLHDDAKLILQGKMLLRRWAGEWVESQACGSLVLVLLRQGRTEEAMQLHQCIHRRGQLHLRGSPWYWGLHLAFLALTGNLPIAVPLFQHALPKVLSRPDLLGQLMFYLPTVIVMDRLVIEQEKPILLHLPDTLSIYRADGRYEPSVLRDWVYRETQTTAEQFDARNGTDYYVREIQRHRDMQRYFTSCPLSEN